MSFSFSGRVQLSKCAKNFTLPGRKLVKLILIFNPDSTLITLIPREGTETADSAELCNSHDSLITLIPREGTETIYIVDIINNFVHGC